VTLKRSLLIAAELTLAVVVAVFAWRALSAQWGEVSRAASDVDIGWGYLSAATLVVLTTYLMLVEVWRRMITAWGERIRFFDAARIWFVSSLARYIPGKLWQVGAMGIMAKQAGVSPLAASGSAVLATLVNLLAGFCVVLLTGSRILTERAGPAASVALVALVLTLALLPLALPRAARLAGYISGRQIVIKPVPARALWIAFIGSIAAWFLYGVAFELLCISILGSATGNTGAYIAVYTASYLVGFLVLFAPGGVGVREMTMIPLMQSLGLASAPQAAVIALISRLWLTVVELGPGLLMLAAARRSAGKSIDTSDAS
jgi:glycosyltransferase 2 family protein